MAEADVRYSFTAQFLRTAVIFARRAADIEKQGSNPDEDSRAEHRGLVTSAIMHSAAAVEAESAEITLHGPGHQLGSNGRDDAAFKFLNPIADVIDDQSVLKRFDLILHLLQKKPMDAGNKPSQHMDLLIRARNELIHYKSKWGQEMAREKLFKSLEGLRFREPFPATGNQNFFPHKFLGSETAKWAAKTAIVFINEFYVHLNVESPLKNHMKHYTGI